MLWRSYGISSGHLRIYTSTMWKSFQIHVILSSEVIILCCRFASNTHSTFSSSSYFPCTVSGILPSFFTAFQSSNQSRSLAIIKLLTFFFAVWYKDRYYYIVAILYLFSKFFIRFNLSWRSILFWSNNEFHFFSSPIQYFISLRKYSCLWKVLEIFSRNSSCSAQALIRTIPVNDIQYSIRHSFLFENTNSANKCHFIVK